VADSGSAHRKSHGKLKSVLRRFDFGSGRNRLFGRCGKRRRANATAAAARLERIGIAAIIKGIFMRSVDVGRGIFSFSNSAVLILLLALVSAPALAVQASSDAGKPLATIDGKAITMEDVESLAAKELSMAEAQYRKEKFRITGQAVNQIVSRRLLEAEAAARHMSVEQLLAEARVEPVSDEDVTRFYEQNKARVDASGKSKEENLAEVRSYLQKQNQATARQALLGGLEKKHDIVILLEPPRVAVAATGPARGPADAAVTIVEFSDFECPFCMRLQNSLAQVMEKYGDRVRLVYRQFPLSFHPDAQKAAEASLCANDQGQFWAMHDAMFADQKGLGIEELRKKAAKLGLNAKAFDDCLDSNKHAATIASDTEDGKTLGVTGTPTVFINGISMSGAQPFDALAKVIDNELQSKKPSAGK
jgi:protein-disulfide isomerase